MPTSLLTFTLVGSALAAGGLYKLRSWSRRELWRILAFGSAVLLVSGLNLLVPSQGKGALWGALTGFAFFFVLESYAIVHSCPEYLEECPVHWLSKLTALALVFHSLLDGLILGVSAQLGAQQFWSVLLAMGIHKFVDAMTCLSLFEAELRAGFYVHLALVMAITLVTPLGVLLASWATPLFAAPHILEVLAGFSAGSLLYIGASDILPRIHRLNDPSCFLFFIGGLLSMVLFLGSFQ